MQRRCSACPRARRQTRLSRSLANTSANGSYGQLVLKPDKGGTLLFSINSVGANGYECSLEGELRGGRATMESGGEKEPCIVTMTPTPAGIEVKTIIPPGTPRQCWSFAAGERH